jgi:hypothetical protein
MWEMARFSTNGPVNLDGGIRVSLSYNSDSSLKGSITNNTPYNFSEAWLVSTQLSEHTTDIYSGNEWKIDAMINNFTIPIDNQLDSIRPTAIDRGNQEIHPPLKAVLARADSEHNFAEAGGYLFIGRIQDSISNLKVAGYSPIDRGEKYIIVPVDIDIKGNEGIIPPSTIRKDVVSHSEYSISSSGKIKDTSAFKHIIGLGENILEWKVPLDTTRYKLQEIECNYNLTGNSPKNMEIYNWYNGRWVNFNSYGKSTGSIIIKDADRFMRRTDGRIKIRVNFAQTTRQMPVVITEFDIKPSFTKRNA